MKSTNELLQEFEAATNAYIDRVAALSQSAINTIPFEGSWTAAQVTEHLCKSDEAMIKTLNGPVQPTNRPTDAGVETLRSIFLDFSSKLPAPEFIIPSVEKHDKEKLLATFKAGRAELARLIPTLDLSATCHMPLLQNPTRYEIVAFITFHTMRHTNQVKRMEEKLAAL